MRTLMVHAAALLLLTGAVACDTSGNAGESRRAAVVTFETGEVLIETETDTFQLDVEIAERNEQRGLGLMERDHLPEDSGMIFLYPDPQGPDEGFYMFRTRIALDIAFMDEDGRIVAIQQMEPCQSSNPQLCRVYTPGVAYTAALEVNRGYFERRDIDLGDRVVFERAEAQVLGGGSGEGEA